MYQTYLLQAGAWVRYITFGFLSPRAVYKGRGGFRAVPDWVTSLNSAPPSGPSGKAWLAQGFSTRPGLSVRARAGRQRRSSPRPMHG